MKVVLFCGGQGLRMRSVSDTLPKPLIPLGEQPLILHLMKYYAHWGHSDFILCIGHRGDAIRDYFDQHGSRASRKLPRHEGGASARSRGQDVADWRITLIDTGLDASIGERLLAVRHLVEDEPVFLANYSDGLTDCPLPAVLDRLERTHATAACLIARPKASFHFMEHVPSGMVTGIRDVEQADLWVNAGFFAFRNQVFGQLRMGQDLVTDLFPELVQQRRLAALPYKGFWDCADTPKDLQRLEALLMRGTAPWEVWHDARPDFQPQAPTRSTFPASAEV